MISRYNAIFFQSVVLLTKHCETSRKNQIREFSWMKDKLRISANLILLFVVLSQSRSLSLSLSPSLSLFLCIYYRRCNFAKNVVEDVIPKYISANSIAEREVLRILLPSGISPTFATCEATQQSLTVIFHLKLYPLMFLLLYICVGVT